MGLPFKENRLSLEDGEVYDSHRKKHEELLDNWEEYPYKQYCLKAKRKKSYTFRKSYVECPCGRKANLNCASKMCSKCCRKQNGQCKVHKIRMSLKVHGVADPS